MKKEQDKKTSSLNCRIRPDIAQEFIKNCYKQDKKISEVLKDCVIAYNRLMEKANGRTVHTLEFKGFDDPKPTDYPADPEKNNIQRISVGLARSGVRKRTTAMVK